MNSAASEGKEVRLSDNVLALKGVLRRRWVTLALVTGVIFAVAAVLILLMTPSYQATARLQIDPNRDPLARSRGNYTPDLDSEAIETEVTLLNSQEVARAVVQRLNLQNDPEFAKDVEAGASVSPADRMDSLVRAVKGNLNVGRDKLTYVINVGFESTDPRKAADIANAFAEEYIRAKIGTRMGTAETQAAFFERRLTELGNEVRAAEAAAAQYRAQTGMIGRDAGTIVDQQVGPLSSQLATAESSAAEARANLNAARAQIARGGLDAVSEVRSSQVVSDLRRQRAEVVRSKGEVDARYGPLHPETVKVQDQLKQLDRQIAEEAERAVASLQAASQAADARVASLRGSLRQLEGQQATNTRASVTGDSLEREAASKRAAYDQMAKLSVDSVQGQRSEIATATIIDRATPPTSPTAPKRSLLLAMALIVAFAGGSATIITQELLVPGIRNVSDLESELGLTVLAAVPKVKGKESPANLIADKSTSLFGESMRIARASILGVRSSEPIKIIAITSTVPAEGKTTTALAFARTLAVSGSRTLLIDCDIRRASLRQTTGIAGDAGLVEILDKQAPVEAAIIADTTEKLDLLPVLRPQYSSEDVFGGDTMAQLLKDLSSRYDHIVLDLPPLLGLADGRFLAALADAVVLVVRWGKTPMRPVAAAVQQLRADDAHLIGAIFAMVDPSSEAIGGLYYSQQYAAYYRAG